MSREEIAWLREVFADRFGLQGSGSDFSAPLCDLYQGRLVVSAGTSTLLVRGTVQVLFSEPERFGSHGHERALLPGELPRINALCECRRRDYTIRYPQCLWLWARRQRMTEIALSSAIPWQIVIRGGGSEVTTELGSLDLLELDANEAGSMFRVELLEPTRVVPIRLGAVGPNSPSGARWAWQPEFT